MAGLNTLEKLVDAVAEGARNDPVARHLPLKLLLSIALGLGLGLIFGVKLALVDGEPIVGAVVGGVLLLMSLVAGVCATIVDHFQTKKRRAGKRAPASFD